MDKEILKDTLTSSKKNTSDLKKEIMNLLYLPQSNSPQKGIKILQVKGSLF